MHNFYKGKMRCILAPDKGPEFANVLGRVIYGPGFDVPLYVREVSIDECTLWPGTLQHRPALAGWIEFEEFRVPIDEDILEAAPGGLYWGGDFQLLFDHVGPFD